MKAVLDSNILIDYLKGIDQAKRELDSYKHPQISIITWIEVMAGASDQDQKTIQKFLNRFEVISLTQEIAETAVEIRKTHRLRLPDAIIWASAQAQDIMFVTRNTKDFPKDHVGIRVPY